MVTVVVINKTYGDLTATLSLANFTPNGNAKVFLYSNANLAAIVAQPDLTVTPPPAGGTTSTLSTTFPAQSIMVIAYSKDVIAPSSLLKQKRENRIAYPVLPFQRTTSLSEPKRVCQ